jgi:hypothetical protein
MEFERNDPMRFGRALPCLAAALPPLCHGHGKAKQALWQSPTSALPRLAKGKAPLTPVKNIQFPK